MGGREQLEEVLEEDGSFAGLRGEKLRPCRAPWRHTEEESGERKRDSKIIAKRNESRQLSWSAVREVDLSWEEKVEW